uniref:RRM domain-containing protein n=1 Tax=Moniliophthora roreri TaxID=221103 RepID=A0A0W0G975_MONRR
MTQISIHFAQNSERLELHDSGAFQFAISCSLLQASRYDDGTCAAVKKCYGGDNRFFDSNYYLRPAQLARSTKISMDSVAISIPTAGISIPSVNHDSQPRRSSRSRSPGTRGEHDGRSADDGRGREDNQNFGNNLHVKGLSHKVDNRDLEAAFAKTGRVQKAQVVYDPHTRESRGFGFVTMESPEEAQAAITALNATELFGKVITVEKVRVEAVPEPLHQENTADHQKEIPLENGHMILDHLIVATPVAEAGATMKTEEGIETEIIIEAETTITEGTEITIGNDVMVAITTMAGDTRSLSQTETHCCLYL